MVPGMWHCAGGPGASNFDVFTPLTEWVEHGVAPDRIIGTHNANTAGPYPSRGRCAPFPQEPFTDGAGDTTEAASFSC